MVKRQGRNGRHLRLRRAMARRRAGTSRAESHLSIRRMQCVWRHVRIPRLQSGGVLHAFPYCSTSSARFMSRAIGRGASAAEEELWRAAMRNPDYSSTSISTTSSLRKGSARYHVSHDDAPWSSTAPSSARKRPSRKSGSRSTRARVLMRTRTASLARRAALLQNVDAPKKLLFHRSGSPGAAVPPIPRTRFIRLV